MATRLIGDCVVFSSASRWTLRLKEWFDRGEDCFRMCTLRSPSTVPDRWEERILRLQTRSPAGTREDLPRKELTWLHAVRAQCDEDGIRRMPEAEPEVSPFLPSGYKQYSTVEKLQHNIMMIRTLLDGCQLMLKALVKRFPQSLRRACTPHTSGGTRSQIPCGEDPGSWTHSINS